TRSRPPLVSSPALHTTTVTAPRGAVRQDNELERSATGDSSRSRPAAPAANGHTSSEIFRGILGMARSDAWMSGATISSLVLQSCTTHLSWTQFGLNRRDQISAHPPGRERHPGRDRHRCTFDVHGATFLFPKESAIRSGSGTCLAAA